MKEGNRWGSEAPVEMGENGIQSKCWRISLECKWRARLPLSQAIKNLADKSCWWWERTARNFYPERRGGVNSKSLKQPLQGMKVGLELDPEWPCQGAGERCWGWGPALTRMLLWTIMSFLQDWIQKSRKQTVGFTTGGQWSRKRI